MKTVIVTKNFEKGLEYVKSNNLNPLETWIDDNDKKAKIMENYQPVNIIYLEGGNNEQG